MRRKVWVGLGIVSLAGAGAATAAGPGMPGLAPGALPSEICRGGLVTLAAGEGHAAHAAPAGGEAGEGGARAGLAPALKFARDLALVRGHLYVASELVQAGRWDQATPHAGHPAKENYAALAPDLGTYGIAPFLAALRALEAAVKVKDKARYDAAWADLDARLGEAERRVAAKAEARPRFLIETALEVLNAATGEYEEAFQDGKLAKTVEYQDGRGFVLHAERLMDAGLTEGGANAEVMQGVREAFAELKKAWPTPLAPARAVMDGGAVLANVSKVELKAGGAL